MGLGDGEAGARRLVEVAGVAQVQRGAQDGVALALRNLDVAARGGEGTRRELLHRRERAVGGEVVVVVAPDLATCDQPPTTSTSQLPTRWTLVPSALAPHPPSWVLPSQPHTGL